MISHDSTHKLTHPPTKPYTHAWVAKSPQIQNLQTELKYQNFTDFGGTPLRGWWVGVGFGGAPPTHVHIPHMHAQTHMLNMINMAAFMVVAICNFLTCLFEYFVHVHACTCMCMCLGTPPCPPMPPTICPLPRATGSPNH